MPPPALRPFAGRAPRLSALPLLVVAIPKCPLCLMLLFGVLGIPHGSHDVVFLSLQAAIVVAALGLLALRRPGWMPFLVALGGVAMMVVGRVWTSSPAAPYAGAAMMVGAWLWAFWPARRKGGCGCAPAPAAETGF